MSNSRLQDIGTFLYSAGMLGIAAFGMAGVIYHSLAPKGLLGPWLNGMWSRHPVLTLLVAIAVVTMLVVARSRTARSNLAKAYTDVPLYVFVILGTFFALRLIGYGTL